MFNIQTLFKRLGTKSIPRNNNNIKSPHQAPSDNQVQTFLYEVEKKLIRLEVSLRRVKEEPATIGQIAKLLNRILFEVEEAYTPEIEEELHLSGNGPFSNGEYAKTLKELKILALHLEHEQENRERSAQVIEQIQTAVKSLLDRQIARISIHAAPSFLHG